MSLTVNEKLLRCEFTLVLIWFLTQVRLLTCMALMALIRRVAAVEAQAVLNPYFSDIILFLQVVMQMIRTYAIVYR